jgi:hypothetical protein
MNLLDFYKNILLAGNMVTDSQGMVSGKYEDKTTPIMIGGKRLILPTRDNLRNADLDAQVMFHPIIESSSRGESDVVSKLRGCINIRLNFIVAKLMSELLTLCTSPAQHAHLSPNQGELLNHCKDADEKTLLMFDSIIEKMGINNKTQCFVQIYLKRSYNLNGKSFNRAAVVSFPFYEELIKDQDTVFGITIKRKKDRATLIKLCKFIFSDIDKPNAFDVGTNSEIAPFLVALMNALIKVVSCIQDVVSEYENFFVDSSIYKYKDDFADVINDLNPLMGEALAIPMQPGNEGSVAAPSALSVAPYRQPDPVARHYGPTPMQQDTGPVITANGGIDFAETMRRRNMGGGGGYGGYPQPFQPQVMVEGPDTVRAGPPRWQQNNGWQNNNQFGNNNPMNSFGRI